MKFSAALFHQTEADLRARMGDRFNPGTNYPAYDGIISIPVDVVPELLDYLSAAQPNERGEIPLRMAGWKRTSNAGKPYLSLSISEDYKTQKAIEERRVQQAAQPSQVAQTAQQLATAFTGHAVHADDPF
jgi:hypothetical protein